MVNMYIICFDSYSRRIMWLHAAMSNNNPEYIATYFVECVRMIGGEIDILIIILLIIHKHAYRLSKNIAYRSWYRKFHCCCYSACSSS